MTWQVSTDGRPQLLRDTELILRNAGWNIPEFYDPKSDFLVQKNDLSFYVQIIDEGMSNLMRIMAMADYMRKDTRGMSTHRGGTLIFVTNFYFPGVGFRELAGERLCVFHVDEIAGLGRLIGYGLTEAPAEELEARELLILEGNIQRCRTISNHFKALGDQDNAIEWARRMLVQNRNPLNCELHVLKLLLEYKRYAEAEEMGEKLLIQTPANKECLQIMSTLALRRGDKATANDIKRRIVRAKAMEVPPTSFEAIIARQRASKG